MPVGVPRSLLIPKHAVLRLTGLTEQEFDAIAHQLPAPVVVPPSGRPLWHREAVIRAIDSLAGMTVNHNDDREARRKAWYAKNQDRPAHAR